MNKLPFLLALILLFACTRQQTVIDDLDSNYAVNPIALDWSADAQEVYFRFNILDKQTDEKVIWSDLKKEHATFLSDNEKMNVKDLSRLLIQKGIIPENIVVSLLVDRSIPQEDMTRVKNAVQSIVNTLPKNTVYISFFDEMLRSTKLINADNFNDFENEFTISKNFKILFSAAQTKFQELCGETGTAANPQLSEKIANPDIEKHLVLLTDGRVDQNNIQTADNIQTFSDYVQAFDKNETNKNRVEIHAIRFGAEKEDVDFTLSYLCVDLRNQNVRGGLYISDPEAFIDRLKVSDKTQPDYELTVENPWGNREIGLNKELVVRLKMTGKSAFVQTNYAIGTILTPVKSGVRVVLWKLLLFGFLIGIAIWGLTFLILQILIPYLRVYLADFDKKHVRYYSFDNETVLLCHYCLNEIRDGDEIVVKCKHTVHKHCWIENGCKCADFGENCKEGKQYLFDSKTLLNQETRAFYTRFALWGLLGGLLTWLLYQTIVYFFPYTLETFITNMLSRFYPGYDEYPVIFLQYIYLLKISSLLTAGLLFGLFPVILLSYANKKREHNFSVIWVCLKSFLGGLAGVAVFLLGSLLTIMCKAAAITFYFDWIPWVLAGCVWAYCLSLHTNVVKKYCMLGGMVAGIVGYLFMFTVAWWNHYGVLIGFMSMGASLGIAFISTRRTVNTYFLKYQGVKLAIYKWMSVAGGSEEVTIGRSENCTINMNWDNHATLRDVNVKLYIDKKDKLPCLKVVDEHITYNRAAAKKNDEFILRNGVKFKIGNTTFQYTESFN
jgi:hypothetical protein